MSKQESIIQKEKSGIKGIWNFYSLSTEKILSGLLTDEEYEKEILDHLEKYKNKQVNSKFPLWAKAKFEARKNLVVNGLIDTIIKNMTGEETGTEDLEGRYIAVGTNNIAPSSGQSQLGIEFYRNVPTDKFTDTNKAIYVLFVNRLTGNGNATAIVADAGNTTTSFKVSSGTASSFNIGDTVRVTTINGFEFVPITNLNLPSDIITVGTALSVVPSGGEAVVQVWAEAAVFGNTNASAIANSGTMFNRVNNLNFVKDNSKIILIEVQFIFTAV